MMYFGDMESWHGFLKERFGQNELDRLYTSGCEAIQINVLYYPDVNVYQNRESLQMVMKDYC
jgi:single-stranded-DNA-specific exonuclease